MFWKIFLFTLFIYISVYCMCPEKCVCGKDQISCLQLETSDQLKLSNAESEGIQKLVLRDSAFQLDKIQKVLPNLQEITLMKSKLITDETHSIDIENETSFIFYTLCMLPIFLIAFLQTHQQEIRNVIQQLHLIHIWVQMCIRVIEGIAKTVNFMYKVLTMLNLAIGKNDN